MTLSPDLVACVVELRAIHSARMERSQGHRAHALFLRLIDTVDPELAIQLHTAASIKPWTVAPLVQQARQLHGGDGYPLRVAFLQSALYRPFARAFLEQPQRVVRLGEGEFSLRAISATSSTNRWAGTVAWSELIGRALPTNTITLQFGAPTAFSQASKGHAKKPYGLFPEGLTVFKSLLRRWNAFSPRCIDEGDLFDAVEIKTKHYELRTEMLLMTKNKQLGFVGTITYEIDGNETSRHLLSALADAALYLGVGAKTTQGMGLVRRIAD